MTERPEIAVVVLAGGEGARMGGGKPLRRFGATTLIGRALALARGYGAPIAVAVRAPEQAGARPDAPLLVDDPAIAGPLAGLASALKFGETSGARLVLTLPCDAPLLPADLAARLAEALTPPASVAVAASGGRLHPTCALWRVECCDELAGYIASGARSLWGFAERCGMVAIEWAVEPTDPFANANTPEELARLAR
jgi:molybdopterin-guanine dinucleotide biosynthesis protein A